MVTIVIIQRECTMALWYTGVGYHGRGMVLTTTESEEVFHLCVLTLKLSKCRLAWISLRKALHIVFQHDY